MKIIVESERHIGNNPFDFLSKNIIPNGSFVSIGYVNDHEISWGPRTKKKITPTNDAQLTQYIEQLPEGKFKNALIAFQESDKYQAALATGKTAPFNIDGDVHIVKIGRFIVNWKNPESFAKFYADRSDAEQQVRVKHGFGKDDTEYPEDDWRRKHAGVGSRPMSKATGRQAAEYKSIGGSGFYTHPEDPNKLYIRQIGNPKASPKPIWLFIDADGTVSYMDNKLMAWLTYAYKSSRTVKDEMEEISQEEQDFLNDLKAIKNMDKSEMKMILDNVLYLTGTTIDDNKVKEPFTWINDDKISELYPYVNKDEWNKVVRKCVKISNTETTNMNENAKVAFKKSYLRKLNEKRTVKRNRKSLNENKMYNSIMKDISKSLKQKLIK